MRRPNTIFLILALAALVAVLASRKHMTGYGVPGHAGIADNEDMQRGADGLIVGDSATDGCDPMCRVALANVPWRRSMGFHQPLRATTITRTQPLSTDGAQVNNAGDGCNG